jgi:DNA (cytosine-5)-methyltransferase 1
MIPVIDLFAGPGGLGEGFSSLFENDKPVFNIRLSIEKDENAHKTLELRSFFRKFPKGQAPSEYYDLLRISDNDERNKARIKLFKKYPVQAKLAAEEAWLAELGGKDFPPEVIDRKIKTALKGSKKWVLIGGPPCQAYSLAGRSRVGGINEKDNRVYLYREYLRIIAVHHPDVFVMENVQGLLSAELNGEKIFHNILKDLREPNSIFPGLKTPGYKIYSFVKKEIVNDHDYLIKAEDFGTPQKRRRVILLGIREDIEAKPSCLEKKDKVTLGSIIDKLPKIRSGISREYLEYVVVNGKKNRKYTQVKDSRDNWEKTINRFKEDILSWNGLIKDHEYIYSPEEDIGSEFIKSNLTLNVKHPLSKWYIDERVGGVINHVSRSHLKQDLLRYLYLSIYNDRYNTFPRINEYRKHSEKLIPDHENVLSGKFVDRFRVQNYKEPATTITSHISKDGHYYIHYDYRQCRSLTVREAARIQTFPDNYLFCGSRTSQFHQVGNAVPPFLAYQLSEIVSKILL